MGEEVVEQIALAFPKWNYKDTITHLIMIIYWLRCIFEPVCCKSKNSILYLWNLCKECMEELCEDKDIKAKCKVMEECVDSYNHPSEPIFTKMLHEF